MDLLAVLVFVVPPLAAGVALAALPWGRAARAGFWTLGALVAAGWAAWATGAGPFDPSGPSADVGGALAFGLLALWTGAVALAGLLQALRPRLAATGAALAYPIAGALAAVLGVLALGQVVLF